MDRYRTAAISLRDSPDYLDVEGYSPAIETIIRLRWSASRITMEATCITRTLAADALKGHDLDVEAEGRLAACLAVTATVQATNHPPRIPALDVKVGDTLRRGRLGAKVATVIVTGISTSAHVLTISTTGDPIITGVSGTLVRVAEGRVCPRVREAVASTSPPI